MGVREVYASDLLPTAYVFLKAVLEYPKWLVDNNLHEQFLKDLARWGNWITEKLKEEMKEFYDEDVAVYIGTWEVKCPHCGRYTPLVGNWWLARVKDNKGGYKRIAWFTFKSGEVEIVDLKERSKIAKVEGNKVKVGNEVFHVPEKNIDPRRSHARCLYCGNVLPGKGDKWYVKESIREWNENYEKYLKGEINLEELKNSKARPRILVRVKVKDKDLKFEPATEEDQEKLWKAAEKLREMWGDPDIPAEDIPSYERRQLMICSTMGACKFFKLFNPRQLLTLVKLVKLIREVGKIIEEEKEEKWGDANHSVYAEIIATYLALALCKYADFNSISTRWNPGWLKFEESLSTRGIAILWSWCDSSPLARFTGTWVRNLENISTGLAYLIPSLSNNHSVIKVLLNNSTEAFSLENNGFNVIVTDPPYKDDVPYTELSDFYYVWLKRALSDIEDVGGMKVLKPKFLKDAFFDEFGMEIETQWKHFADKEISEAKGREKYFGEGVGTFEHFKKLLSQAFKNMTNSLKDSGLLVTYYAHTSPEAWAALLEAGWKNAGLRVTTTWPVLTELSERVTGRGKASLDVSIVVVWRKGVGGSKLIGEVRKEALEECSEVAREAWFKGHSGLNLLIYTMGCVLSKFTQYKYENLVGFNGKIDDLISKYIFPTTVEVLLRALVGPATLKKLSSVSTLYLASKILSPGEPPRTLDKDRALILSVMSGMDLNEFIKHKVLERSKGGKKAEYVLLEPCGTNKVKALRELLKEKELDPQNPKPRNALDVLHLMEYYALKSTSKDEFLEKLKVLKDKNPAAYDEALVLVEALCKILIEEELEAKVIKEVAKILGTDCRIVSSKDRRFLSLESFVKK